MSCRKKLTKNNLFRPGARNGESSLNQHINYVGKSYNQVWYDFHCKYLACDIRIKYITYRLRFSVSKHNFPVYIPKYPWFCLAHATWCSGVHCSMQSILVPLWSNTLWMDLVAKTRWHGQQKHIKSVFQRRPSKWIMIIIIIKYLTANVNIGACLRCRIVPAIQDFIQFTGYTFARMMWQNSMFAYKRENLLWQSLSRIASFSSISLDFLLFMCIAISFSRNPWVTPLRCGTQAHWMRGVFPFFFHIYIHSMCHRYTFLCVLTYLGKAKCCQEY